MILTPIVTVECDQCGRTSDYQMTPLSNNCWDMRGATRSIERDFIAFGDQHFCDEDCRSVHQFGPEFVQAINNFDQKLTVDRS